MQQLLKRAELFARNAHKDQFRDGGEPYIVHPEQVAQLLSTVTQDENIIAAGWLHDVIEDCNIPRERLATVFNETVADLVHEVTMDRTDGVKTFPRLKTREGIMIKFADRLSNLSGMDGWTDDEVQTYLDKSRFWK